MSSALFIQLFLFLEVFIMGVLASVAARHAWAHFHPHVQEQVEPLPAAVKTRLLKAAESQFQTSLTQSANQLESELRGATKQVNNLVKQMATEIVGDELERYRLQLAELHKQAEADIATVKAELDSHKATVKAEMTNETKVQADQLKQAHDELRAKMEADIAAEKQLLIDQIDMRLADAVGSFLVEALGHEIDLGAQNAYLVNILEQHKEDFKREVGSDD